MISPNEEWRRNDDAELWDKKLDATSTSRLASDLLLEEFQLPIWMQLVYWVGPFFCIGLPVLLYRCCPSDKGITLFFLGLIWLLLTPFFCRKIARSVAVSGGELMIKTLSFETRRMKWSEIKDVERVSERCVYFRLKTSDKCIWILNQVQDCDRLISIIRSKI